MGPLILVGSVLWAPICTTYIIDMYGPHRKTIGSINAPCHYSRVVLCICIFLCSYIHPFRSLDIQTSRYSCLHIEGGPISVSTPRVTTESPSSEGGRRVQHADFRKYGAPIWESQKQGSYYIWVYLGDPHLRRHPDSPTSVPCLLRSDHPGSDQRRLH